MICLLAMIVAGILGIFSASYRSIAKEAFDCVFRRITFRKCDTGLDNKLKSKITGRFMRISPKLASTVYRNFEVISWIFTLLLVVSLGYSAYGIYNYAAYGNCNGPESSAFCIFNPGSLDTPEDSELCSVGEEGVKQELSAPVIDDYSIYPSFGPQNATTVIEFGCFECPYSKDALEYVERLRDEEVRFIFINFPLEDNHPGSETAAEASLCAYNMDPEIYWHYHRALFEDIQEVIDEERTIEIAKTIGYDGLDFGRCMKEDIYAPQILQELELGQRSGVYGTPTFFAGDDYVVGPKSYDEIQALINRDD